MLRSARTSAALLAGIAAVATVGVLVAPRVGESGHEHDVHAEERVYVSQSAYPFDIGDDELLVGASDNVFVGRVTKLENDVSESATSDPPMAQSQFSVEVDENIKGQLDGTVTVNQAGGYVVYYADRDYPEYGLEEGGKGTAEDPAGRRHAAGARAGVRVPHLLRPGERLARDSRSRLQPRQRRDQGQPQDVDGAFQAGEAEAEGSRGGQRDRQGEGTLTPAVSMPRRPNVRTTARRGRRGSAPFYYAVAPSRVS